MLALYRVTAYASEHSFYSRLMEMPAATLYRLQLLPVLVPMSVWLRWDCCNSSPRKLSGGGRRKNDRIRQRLRRCFKETLKETLHKAWAIPHKERLATLHAICLQIFRHISQKCS